MHLMSVPIKTNQITAYYQLKLNQKNHVAVKHEILCKCDVWFNSKFCSSSNYMKNYKYMEN